MNLATTEVGCGPPVFLLHGNPDNRHSWDPVIAALDDGVRCVAPDFPGFGESPEPPADFDFRPDSTVPMWERFFDERRLDGAVVVLHDFGIPWALPFAAANPERLSGLVLSNGPFQHDFPWHRWARIWQTPLLGELASALSVRLVFRLVMRNGDPALPADYPDTAHDELHATARRTVLRTYRAWADMPAALGPWEERAVEVARTVPTRVVWGGLDPYLSRDLAHRFGVEPEIWDDVGHWTYISRPERFAGVVRDLLPEAR